MHSAQPDRVPSAAVSTPRGGAQPESTSSGEGRVIQLPLRQRGISQLSPRELQVLELVATGLETAEIARQLSVSEATFIAEETVKSLQRCVLTKLSARSTAHAVAIALHRSLIHLDASN